MRWMYKTVGRFELTVFEGSGDCKIQQTHANGSNEVIAEFIQLDANLLQDLKYVVDRAIERQRSILARRGY